MYLGLFFASLFVHNFFLHYFISWKLFFLFVLFYILKEREKLLKFAVKDVSVNTGIFLVFYSLLIGLWVPYRLRHFVLSVALFVSILVYTVLLYHGKEIRQKISTINGVLLLLLNAVLLIYFYNIFTYTPLQLHAHWVSAVGKRYILGNSHLSFTFVGIDLLPRLSGLHLGPNLFSLYCGIALFLGIRGFRKNRTWISGALILVSVLSLFLTLSRGGILSMGFSMLLAAMVLSLRKRDVRPVLIYFIISISICVLVFLIVPDIRHILEVRFSSMWNGSELRFRYWGDYVLFMGKFLGRGFGFGENVFGYYAHNTYLSVLIGLGILGLTIFLFLLSFHVVAAFSKAEFESLGLLFFIVLLGLTLDLQFEVGFWMALALVRIFSGGKDEYSAGSS